jgi:branched-chain amino acid transport system ATP-binding protein
VIGPNGSGKSTLLNVIAGVHAPSDGRALLDGRTVSGLPPEQICRLGLARTHQIAQPFGDLTSRENVMVGAFARTHSRQAAMAKADELLARLGIAHLADTPVRIMTVAERKKIEIARALATEPRILLLDEALAGLTEQETEQMIRFLLGLRREGLTLIVVEHVMRVVTALCDRVMVLNFGKLLAEGRPDDVLRHPEVVRAYLGSDDHAP